MQKYIHRILIAAGFGLLAFMIWKLGPMELYNEFSKMGWGLAVIVLLEGVADIFHTIAWRYCLDRTHQQLSLPSLYLIRMAGTAINYVTPTGTLGGEVVKGALLGSESSKTRAASGVIIGKLSYVLAQLLFIATGSVAILWRVGLPVKLWVSLIVSSVILGSGIIGFLLVQKYGKLGAVLRWVSRWNIGRKQLDRFTSVMNEVDDLLREYYRERPFDLPKSMIWHVVGFVCGIVQVWYFLHLVGGEAPFKSIAAIWFLGSWFDLVSFPVPAGIGVQEGSRLLIFDALGLTRLQGLTFGLSLRIEQIFWALAGMVSYSIVTWGQKRGKFVVRFDNGELNNQVINASE